MKNIIEELQSKAQHELAQVGITPRTNFLGTQEEHNKLHSDRAREYLLAASLLTSDCPITEQGEGKTPEEINKETNEIIEKIEDESKNGNIVLMTVEGLVVVKLEDFIKQPADGILYDLNKNESVALTFLRNQEIRGINDFAAALTIKALKSKLEENK